MVQLVSKLCNNRQGDILHQSGEDVSSVWALPDRSSYAILGGGSCAGVAGAGAGAAVYRVPLPQHTAWPLIRGRHQTVGPPGNQPTNHGHQLWPNQRLSPVRATVATLCNLFRGGFGGFGGTVGVFEVDLASLWDLPPLVVRLIPPPCCSARREPSPWCSCWAGSWTVLPCSHRPLPSPGWQGNDDAVTLGHGARPACRYDVDWLTCYP